MIRVHYAAVNDAACLAKGSVIRAYKRKSNPFLQDGISSFGVDWNEFFEGTDLEQVEVPDPVCPCGDYDSTTTALSACYDATFPCEELWNHEHH